MKNLKANFKIQVFCFSVLIFVLSACAGDASSKSNELQIQKFFDLKSFFENETEMLAQMSSFKKTVYVKGEREEKELDKLDFAKELEIFSESDINRPAWSDKYEIDSIFNDQNELVKLSYLAKDEKLNAQKIQIDFSEMKVQKIQIENVSQTSIAKTSQSLIYEPLKGYSIESRQNVTLMDDATFKIEVAFQ